MSEKKEKKGAEGGKGIARGYGMNECPRPAELGAFGLQHALLILFQTLPAPLLIAGGLGFGPLETSILIASALFVSGICTFVQSFGVGPLGADVYKRQGVGRLLVGRFHHDDVLAFVGAG